MTAPNTTAAFALDFSFLNSFTNNDPKRMIRMIDMMISSLPGDLEELTASAASEDWEQVGKLAHTLLPKFRFMGVPRLTDAVSNLEQSVRYEKNFDGAADTVEAIVRDARTAMQLLQKKKEELAND